MKLTDAQPERGVAPDFSAPIHEGTSQAEKLIIGGPVNLDGEKSKSAGAQSLGGLLPQNKKLIDSYSDFVRQSRQTDADLTTNWSFKPRMSEPPVPGSPISPFRMPPALSNKGLAPVGVTGPVESHWTDSHQNSHWIMSDGRAYRQNGNGSVFFDGDYGSPEAALDFLKHKNRSGRANHKAKRPA